jgi:hypothetical protein
MTHSLNSFETTHIQLPMDGDIVVHLWEYGEMRLASWEGFGFAFVQTSQLI